MAKITAGRDHLGELAPQFAALNDDVLFGQVWAREETLPAKTRSIITIAALMGAGITDRSLAGHLELGRDNGITREEIVEIITHLAFYVGWPKAWAVFAQVGELWSPDEQTADPAQS